MQLSPINSFVSSRDIQKTQNTSSLLSVPTCSLPMAHTGNTNETPLTLCSNQTTTIRDHLTYSSAVIGIPSFTKGTNLTSKNPDEISSTHEIDTLDIDTLDTHPHSFAADMDDMINMLDVHPDSFTDDIDILNIHPVQFSNGVDTLDIDMLDIHPDSFADDMNDMINTLHMHSNLFTVDTDMPNICPHSFAVDMNHMIDLPPNPFIADIDRTPNAHPDSFAIDALDDMPNMLPHSSATRALQEDISSEEQQFAQSYGNIESISDINEPYRSNTEAKLQNPYICPVASMDAEALQENSQSSDELMLKSFLLDIFKENIKDYEQALFKAYVENDTLKEKYFDLSVSALNIINACKLIKTRIAHLSYDTKNMSHLKYYLYGNLSDALINYSRYRQLIEELKPQEIQIPIEISIKKIKKINKKVAEKIQILKKRNQCNQRNYDTTLDQTQIIEPLIIQKMPLYLTGVEATKIFQDTFINLSIAKIKEIIFSSKTLLQNQNNTDTKIITKTLQESVESNEILILEYLMKNIFTVPFFFDKQILFKSYKEEHPLKDKYLMLMISALKAQNALLNIKTRIIQLNNLEQEENCTVRQEEMIKTVLCKKFAELLTSSYNYYQFMDELKPSKALITDKISTIEMNKIDTAPVDQIRALQIQLRGTQRYYNTILNDKQTSITENQMIQHIFHYLTEEKILRNIQKKFTTLSIDQIKSIILSTKILPPIEDNANTENVTDLSQKKDESEEALSLEAMLINIFKYSFYYDEQALFNAYTNNTDSKKDFLAFTIATIQAQRACLQIKIRIAQLIKLKQKENSRECEISTVKNYLYRDLVDLFINSSNYNQLIDKLQPSIIQMQEQKKKYISPKIIREIDKDMENLNHRKKTQLYQTKKYLNAIIKQEQITENQIIQNIHFYLTEPKGIETFKEIFTSLTEEKIKGIIAHSVSRIEENQNKDAREITFNKRLCQKRQSGNLSDCLTTPTNKKRIRKSKASASLALPASTASSQNPSQSGVLKFSASQSQALTAREPSQSTEIHFLSQNLQSKSTQEEIEYAKAGQLKINATSATKWS